jgi:hypothetical protein
LLVHGDALVERQIEIGVDRRLLKGAGAVVTALDLIELFLGDFIANIVGHIVIHRGGDALVQVLLELGVGPSEYGLLVLVFTLIAAQKTLGVEAHARVGRHGCFWVL